MSCSTRIVINQNRVKAKFFSKIKNAAIDADGIIFGGFVRDEIIAEHYKKQFYDNIEGHCNETAFWNESFCPETSHRTIVAEDIDIAFRTMEYADKFIEKIITLVEREVGSKINYIIEEKIQLNKYSALGVLKSVRTITFTLVLGHIPFTYDGITLSIPIDVVVPISSNILPPFKNLDMLCNAFIMTRNGISLSKHTGTCIDKLTAIERSIVGTGIMKDIIQFKTDFAFGARLCKTGTYKLNKYAFKRVEKMMNKFPIWDIQNLPFIHEKITDGSVVIDSESNDTCCICMLGFDVGNSKLTFHLEQGETKLKSSILHKHCMLKYIDTQMLDFEESFANENTKFEFKCPYRNGIDFIKCAHSIKEKIMKMKTM